VPPLVALPGIKCEQHVGAHRPNQAHQPFDNRFAIFKFEQPVVVSQIDVVISWDAKLTKGGQFLLATNLGKLCSREI
jgi:hypothetical protein